MIPSYASIYNLGHKAIIDLFKDEVVIQEKADGSQFSFGVIDDELQCRSHHQQIDLDNPPKLFAKAVDYIKSIEHMLQSNWIYRGEVLDKPHHNILCYDREPKHNIILYDIDKGTEDYLNYEQLKIEADALDLEIVPQFYKGKIDTFEQFKSLLDKTSVLGGQKIEGVVIKNYYRFGIDKHCLMGKYVNEKFKEMNQKEHKTKSHKDILTEIGMKFRTEARWFKAIQHLKEQDKLSDSPKDIGHLLKEINEDILKECSESMKDMLFKWAWKSICKQVTIGFPEFYKEYLAKKQFEDNNV